MTMMAKSNYSAHMKQAIGVVFLLAIVFATAQPAGAQQPPWATSGNNINNTNTGNVGIGTTTPGVKLEVNVPVTTSLVTSSTDLGSSAIVIRDNGGQFNSKVGILGSSGAVAGDLSAGLLFGREGTSWGTYVAFY